MLQKFIIKQRNLVSLLFLSLTLISCGQIGPYIEPIEPDAIPPGPGLFSGDTGSFTIRSDRRDTDTNTSGVSDAEIVTKDSAEFEQFKEWQKLKSETSSSPQAKQYEEFQLWLKFKKIKAVQ